ncbi:MAG: hypothetical protein JFT11_11040 [Muribaculaceae bacterium]|nr:hypothetical protein [Muribaculaceae bacterium]
MAKDYYQSDKKSFCLIQEFGFFVRWAGKLGALYFQGARSIRKKEPKRKTKNRKKKKGQKKEKRKINKKKK